MTAKFKFIVNKAEAFAKNLPFEFKETSDVVEVLAAIGRKSLHDPKNAFSYRNRFDRPKIFSGARSAQLVHGSIKPKTDSLEALAEKNDVQGYVSTWLALNKLKEAA